MVVRTTKYWVFLTLADKQKVPKSFDGYTQKLRINVHDSQYTKDMQRAINDCLLEINREYLLARKRIVVYKCKFATDRLRTDQLKKGDYSRFVHAGQTTCYLNPLVTPAQAKQYINQLQIKLSRLGLMPAGAMASDCIIADNISYRMTSIYVEGMGEKIKSPMFTDSESLQWIFRQLMQDTSFYATMHDRSVREIEKDDIHTLFMCGFAIALSGMEKSAQTLIKFAQLLRKIRCDLVATGVASLTDIADAVELLDNCTAALDTDTDLYDICFDIIKGMFELAYSGVGEALDKRMLESTLVDYSAKK